MGRRNIRALLSLAENKNRRYIFRPAHPAIRARAPSQPPFTPTLNRLTTASGSPHDDTPSAPLRACSRLPWLDFFRGLAVLVMIEAHVVNTFLASALREAAWFPLLNFANGLVAPSFLFIAGFVHGRESRTASRKPINYRRRANRLLGIGALGAALHFPFAELAQHRWADALRIGTQFDVLHCLAVSLGLLLGLSWLVKNGAPGAARRARWSRTGWWIGVAVLATIAVLSAPTIAAWTSGPVPLRAVFNQTTGSLFPLLPWTGFVLFGALAGAWPAQALHQRAAGLIGLAAAAWACRGAEFSAVSPAFFLERAACVLVLAALCEWRAHRPLPAWILFAGKHSLKLYVAHLVLITALAGLGLPSAGLPLPATLALLAAVAAVSLTATFLSTRLPEWVKAREAAGPDAGSAPALPLAAQPEA